MNGTKDLLWSAVPYVLGVTIGVVWLCVSFKNLHQIEEKFPMNEKQMEPPATIACTAQAAKSEMPPDFRALARLLEEARAKIEEDTALRRVFLTHVDNVIVALLVCAEHPHTAAEAKAIMEVLVGFKELR